MFVSDPIAIPSKRPYADPMRMIGRKSPEGTAIPKVKSPNMQYRAKKVRREVAWYSLGVLVEKMFRTASSFVVRRRVARSL